LRSSSTVDLATDDDTLPWSESGKRARRAAGNVACTLRIAYAIERDVGRAENVFRDRLDHSLDLKRLPLNDSSAAISFR
jgi:hypothetical protein